MASSLVLCLVSLLMATISTTTCTPQELNRDANSDPTDRPSGSHRRPETPEMSGGPWRSIKAELALDALVTALAAAIPFPQIPGGISGFHCWNASGLTAADIAARVPTVSFNFTGANYELSYLNTFVSAGDANFCLYMIPGSPSIIGNYQQRNVYVVYDRANSQIGFVPRNCSDVVSF
ncbi:hypothetical protein AXG93_4134s1040 [Marchantia polymorpha subsp. ruderalis]|uniref:Peptidase A1 domain-containing protein n=1 Tax=Marchantia polymorpha subsp. ruderalis TaxID=1480154 RepID=A0A176VG32_MARPO|nr:hypothetical protein AXG93_4134s1040 [Marchantia polymorpha subsp. ruderalis]